MTQFQATATLQLIHIEGNTAGPKPETNAILVKIIGGTVKTGDLLKFYLEYTEANLPPAKLSWEYTVLAGDDFESTGVQFNISPSLVLNPDITFTNGEVYNMSVW